MLLSEKKERERHFKLALRAAIPILSLVSLIFYSLFFRDHSLGLNLESEILMGAIVFISVYFIYFLIVLGSKETLIDQQSQSYTKKAFINQVLSQNSTTLALLTIDNIETIQENYSYNDIDILLYTFVHKLNQEFETNNLKNTIIARGYSADFMIGIDIQSTQVKEILTTFKDKNTTLNNIELDINFAVITNNNSDITKTLTNLKDIIKSQDKNKKSIPIYDAQDISQIESYTIEALKHKELKLSFRPILNLKKNRIDIYELSTKLYYKRKTILPKTFLPIINRLGLGREYDLILFEKVLDILPLIDDDICISFNLSPFSLRDSTFQKTFFKRLEDSKIDPSRLIIELYEKKTHHNLSSYLEILKTFRAKGIQIAIDNFGSSNASMEYMKHFHFDLVQFDRDFVANIEDSNTNAMLKSLIEMSKSMNIVTVAKWVDNSTKKIKLQEMGIEYIQGFSVGKPISQIQLIEQS
jgi:EAL domain-containing protein (putative c-di-GMP-specific phosphodiesterase class I)/GGDEF domain-containing protein